MGARDLFSFFVRQESADDHLATGQSYADDMDLIVSERDGMLVAVAEVHGVHACWHCFKQFVQDPTHKHRPVEFNCGGHGTRILIHAGCVKGAGRYQGDLFADKVSGHQARRFATKAAIDGGSDDG
jgi:hypothetical protein